MLYLFGQSSMFLNSPFVFSILYSLNDTFWIKFSELFLKLPFTIMSLSISNLLILCINTYIHTYIYIHIHISISISKFIYIYIYMYMYVSINVYSYLYLPIYIYSFQEVLTSSFPKMPFYKFSSLQKYFQLIFYLNIESIVV